jgi:hypothetical protein
VRIGPIELGDGAGELDGLFGVEFCRKRVVSDNRPDGQEQTNADNEENGPDFHDTPPRELFRHGKDRTRDARIVGAIPRYVKQTL